MNTGAFPVVTGAFPETKSEWIEWDVPNSSDEGRYRTGPGIAGRSTSTNQRGDRVAQSSVNCGRIHAILEEGKRNLG